MQVAFYIIPTARKYKQKQLTSNQLNDHEHRENLYIKCASERGNFRICTFPTLLFLSMFELVLTNFVCMFVGYFVTQCTLHILCAVSLLMLMTWHLQTPHKLPATRPHRDNICMQARKMCRISAFKTCYFFHYFCWYFFFTPKSHLLATGKWIILAKMDFLLKS